MLMTKIASANYAGPIVAPLGDAVELTMGNGEIDVDYLGNTSTYYGKWINREAEERDDEQPATDGSSEDNRGDS
jgi:hypothetical protein